MTTTWFFAIILSCSSPGFCDGREIYVSPMGRNNLNCTTMENPCRTIQYAIDNVAVSHDVIKIDGMHGNFTVERSVIFECMNLTFTSYNGVASIYGGRKQPRLIRFSIFLAVHFSEIFGQCEIMVTTINFFDAVLFISQHWFHSKNKTSITLTVRNCHFDFSGLPSNRYQHLISMKSQYSDITMDNCTVKANYQIGMLYNSIGQGCIEFTSANIILKNTRIEDARYTVHARIQKCADLMFEKSFQLTILSSVIKSKEKSGRYQPRAAQVLLHDRENGWSKVYLSIYLENSRFENLSAATEASAVADIRGANIVFIRNCTFKGNFGYRGGALSLTSNAISISQSQFHDNQARLNTICGRKDQGGYGGAIFIDGREGLTTMSIYNTSFINNMATCFGSAVYLAGIHTIVVKQTHFSTRLASSTDTIWFSYSRNLQVDQVSFEVREESIIDGEFFFAKANAFKLGERTPFFKCPISSIINISEYTDKCSRNSKRKEVKCQFCSKGTYTLAPGTTYGFRDNKSKQSKIQTQCQSCSFGAVCQRGITSKPNFWGYVHKSIVFMIVCPPDYCCQTPNQCKALNSCNFKRTGRLCGKCNHGYFQSVFTNECLEEKVCNTGKFWTLTIIVCLLFTLIFIFLQDIFLVIVKLLNVDKSMSAIKSAIDWLIEISPFKKKDTYQLEQTNHNERRGLDPINNESNGDRGDEEVEVSEMEKGEIKHESKNNSTAGGLIKIVFFFYQVNSVLTVYKSNREIRYLSKLKALLLSIFNLNAQIPLTNDFHCPFHGIDSTTGVWIKSLFLFNSLIFTALLYIYLYALSYCFGSNGCTRKYSKTAKLRLLTAILQLILLGYSTLTSSILSLLTCISLVTGEKILYIDGSINCYQNWQYAILMFIVLWAIPLIYALHKLPTYMRNGEISIRGVYIALLLPLPFAAYTMVGGVKRRKRYEMDDGSNVESMTTSIPYVRLPQINVIMSQLLNVIEGPFCYKTSGEKREKLSWEPILLLQRLLLLLCRTFVLDPSMRSLLLLLLIIIFANMNFLHRPYSSPFLNVSNSITFVLLCITAIINVVYAFIYEYGIISKGPLVQLLCIFDYVECMMIIIFPVIAVGSVVILAVAKLIVFAGSIVGFLIVKCKRFRLNDDKMD